jgi:protein SCO1/2
MLAGFTLANGFIAIVALLLLLNREQPPPQIHGVFLADPRPLPSFELIDHRGSTFKNSELIGDWTLVSYGFTTCPDICPTTLAHLNDFTQQLKEMNESVPTVAFYSVDHRRDTVTQMASYVSFFNPDFIGLTHEDNPENPHLPFEAGLGIMAKLTPLLDDDGVPRDDYSVSHGVHLILINPAGELQAIFEPEEVSPGIHVFDTELLVQDYLAIMHYIG